MPSKNKSIPLTNTSIHLFVNGFSFHTPYKTEFTPVSHWGPPAGSVEFLGSGETWFTEDNEFFNISQSDLEEWDSVTVEVKIGSIEID